MNDEIKELMISLLYDIEDKLQNDYSSYENVSKTLSSISVQINIINHKCHQQGFKDGIEFMERKHGE